MSSPHTCQLQIVNTSELPELSPNSSYLRKCFRYFRHLCLLDLNNKTCSRFFRNLSKTRAEKRNHLYGEYKYIIHPFSKLNAWRKYFMFIVYIFALFFTPIHTAFYPKRFSDDTILGIVITFILNGIFIVNIMFTFCVGYLDSMNRAIVLKPQKIFWKYVRNYFFFELFGFIQYALIVSVLCPSINDFVLEYISLTYLLQGSRIPYLRNSVVHFIETRKGKEKFVLSCWYIVQTVIILNILACLNLTINNIVELKKGLDPFSSNNTSRHEQLTPEMLAIKYENYFVIFYYATCLFFGTGSGYAIDLYHEKIVATIILIGGRLYTLLLLAHLLHTFGVINYSETTYEDIRAQICEFMNDKQFPINLQQRIDAYYEFMFQKSYFKEEPILRTLTTNLRDEIHHHMCRNIVQKCYIFRSFDKSVILPMIRTFRRELFLPGDVIVQKGQKLNQIYMIESGTSAMYIDRFEIKHLTDGDEIGGVSALRAKDIAMYQHVAAEETELFRWNFEEFLSLCITNIEFNRRTTRRMNDKLKENQKLYSDAVAREEMTAEYVISKLRLGMIVDKRRKRIRLIEQ